MHAQYASSCLPLLLSRAVVIVIVVGFTVTYAISAYLVSPLKLSSNPTKARCTRYNIM